MACRLVRTAVRSHGPAEKQSKNQKPKLTICCLLCLLQFLCFWVYLFAFFHALLSGWVRVSRNTAVSLLYRGMQAGTHSCVVPRTSRKANQKPNQKQIVDNLCLLCLLHFFLFVFLHVFVFFFVNALLFGWVRVSRNTAVSLLYRGMQAGTHSCVVPRTS